MKKTSIQKPVLNTAQALRFATGATTAGAARGRARAGSKGAPEAGKRVFFAPEGDKRLTINLRDDLHKKLKILAVEQDTTVGELIESLVERHL